MKYGIKLHVWGKGACFTRPEFKAERYTYDVITPSAARAVCEAIHWKPAIKWIIEKIHVCNPIERGSFRRNEISSKIKNPSAAMKKQSTEGISIEIEKDRTQRAMVYLRNPSYVIEARFEMTDKAGERDSEEKHYAIFCKRAKKGKCFTQPYLGTREFPANFELLEDDAMPEIKLTEKDHDFGFMLYDVDYKNGNIPIPYRAVMKNGIIDVTEGRKL